MSATVFGFCYEQNMHKWPQIEFLYMIDIHQSDSLILSGQTAQVSGCIGFMHMCLLSSAGDWILCMSAI